MERNTKLFKVILLPFVLAMFLIGWSLAYFGSNNVDRKANEAAKVKEHIELEFGVMPEAQRIPLH